VKVTLPNFVVKLHRRMIQSDQTVYTNAAKVTTGHLHSST